MDGWGVLIALGTAGGALGGWVLLTFVGGPLRKFFDLRGEIIRRLTEFANVRARYKVLPDGSLGVGGLEELGQIHQADDVPAKPGGRRGPRRPRRHSVRRGNRR